MDADPPSDSMRDASPDVSNSMSAVLPPEPLPGPSPARDLAPPPSVPTRLPLLQPTSIAGAQPPALSRSGTDTLAEQLAQRYAHRIQQRLLAPGARLPSVRECARRHRVSPTTVVAAYDQLQAQGLVEARRHRGFFVREPRELREPRDPRTLSPTQAPGSRRPRPLDATALIRSMFHHGRGGADPGMGTLPPGWLDLPLLHGALRRAMQQDSGALEYGEPAGDARLRQALVQRLASLGINATAGQIVTTIGATHALDVVSRALLQPGDAVLVDEPGWAIEYARLSGMGMRLLPVPRGPQGPDLDVMRSLLHNHRPRMYVTVSVLHNPTGCTLPLAAAHQVLKLAEAHDLVIVEDDTYAYLAPPHAPRMAALDDLQRTVYISGFSKVLAPNWRVGFVAASPALAERLIDVKLLSTLSSPSLPERAIALCLEQGLMRRHADRVVAQLDAARSRTQQLALDAGCRFVTPPNGLFGWVDTGVDTDRLAHALLDEGWLLAPGSLFHATPRPTTLMRINFATSQDVRFWQALVAARRNM
jgi:DNA-binding transcriptional MocR family regulator